jgi:UDP-N-acetylglucosamine 2-epimerase (non-hydrolysing)
MNRLKVMVMVGTRPEAIKMAPVVRSLEGRKHFETVLVSTGQHREMLEESLRAFALRPDHDLETMVANQGLAESTARVLEGMAAVYRRQRPDIVLVEGDTTSVVAAAQAAYYEQIAVGHVEAGLRTGDKFSPFPEEMNRRMVGVLADLHFAPTPSAKDALLKEGVEPGSIFVTGNTVVDALLWVAERADKEAAQEAQSIVQEASGKRLILAELHRRESLGEPLASVCRALATMATRDGVEVVFSVHKNPKVQETVHRELARRPGVRLLEPPDYASWVLLMKSCHFIVTDSGGIQEEAPSLGKPVLVAREVTERKEGAEAGVSLVVGTEETRLVQEMERLLSDSNHYSQMASGGNPYGDGHAAERISQAILYHFGQSPTRPDEFCYRPVQTAPGERTQP